MAIKDWFKRFWFSTGLQELLWKTHLMKLLAHTFCADVSKLWIQQKNITTKCNTNVFVHTVCVVIVAGFKSIKRVFKKAALKLWNVGNSFSFKHLYVKLLLTSKSGKLFCIHPLADYFVSNYQIPLIICAVGLLAVIRAY